MGKTKTGERWRRRAKARKRLNGLAVSTLECPECGAEPGDGCVGEGTHAARREKLMEQLPTDKDERDAILQFRCPSCGAQTGEPCESRETHKRRIAKVTRWKKGKKGSVRAISGGGFESNRRRH